MVSQALWDCFAKSVQRGADATLLARIIKAYNPDQLRDSRGRWVSSGAGSPDKSVAEAMKQFGTLREALRGMPAGKKRDALGEFLSAIRTAAAKRLISITADGEATRWGKPVEQGPRLKVGSLEYGMQEQSWLEAHAALQRANSQISTLRRTDLGDATEALRSAIDAVKDAAKSRRIIKSYDQTEVC